MSGNIQQQMYTRERGGIFHTTDGYDTIAISLGLDQTFVKKYLHPFCMYYAPKALSERGEKDPSLYPEAVTLFQPETGDLVIGQAVFVPADFTGSRSTYFMHNYVIPAGQKEEWIKQPEKLFQINDFQTSYDTALGKILPEREVLGYDSRAVKSELLVTLEISEEQFKQLLFAVMSSIAGKKKVFISLNVPLKDYTKYALELLELLFLYLPFAYRRKLGAITFTSEPTAKNYIHVVFFEPGTLNTRDRAIEKQYIFDFADSRISGVDLQGQQHEYLDFAMHHFTESERMDDFFEFAERAVSGLIEEQQLELSSYYRLTAIYLTIQSGDNSLYQMNKLGFLQGLLSFLQVRGDEKPELIELFLRLLKEEKIAVEKDSALDTVSTVVSFNKVMPCDEALFFILDTLEYYQHDLLFPKLWKVIEEEQLTFRTLVTFSNEHPDYESLLSIYLDERFKPVARVEDILSELRLLLGGAPYLLNIKKFTATAFNKVATAISFESNPFKAVLTVKDFTMDSGSAEFSQFKNDLFVHAIAALLRSIRLQELSHQDIMMFGRIFIKELDVKDARARENYVTLHTLYQLLSNPSQAGFVSLKPLSEVARDQLRGILQKLLRNNPSVEHLPLLVVAFGSEYDRADYQGLLEHLIRYSDQRTILSFIRGNARRIETDDYFKNALSQYLTRNPQSIWKNKTLRQELKLIKNCSFKQLLKEVEAKTSHPLVKYLKRRK